MKRAMPTRFASDRQRGNRRIGADRGVLGAGDDRRRLCGGSALRSVLQGDRLRRNDAGRQAQSGVKGARALTVRFDANVAPGLDWSFEPETDSVRLRTGATATVFFRVRNRQARETAAVAVYNVTPEVSGAWFDKISCFCFSEQRLGPNESAELPVVFFLDPRLEQDHTMDKVDAITLSYTLFAPTNASKPVALAPSPSGERPQL